MTPSVERRPARRWLLFWVALFGFARGVSAQTLDLEDAIRVVSGLTNTTAALPLSVEPTTLRFQYPRPALVTDVRYQVEWATTLRGTWTSAGVSQQIINDDGVIRTLRATLPKGSGQRFVRLKVFQ